MTNSIATSPPSRHNHVPSPEVPHHWASRLRQLRPAATSMETATEMAAGF